MGEVRDLMRRNMVKVIKGRPYNPQSQGKVERNNRIIKKKISYETQRSSEKRFNWANNLKKITSAVNRQPKKVLGYQTPFAV